MKMGSLTGLENIKHQVSGLKAAFPASGIRGTMKARAESPIPLFRAVCVRPGPLKADTKTGGEIQEIH